jgi:glutaminyl-tRNA synthetase
MSTAENSSRRAPGKDFLRAIVEEHVAEGRYKGIVTRFPPEPNGFLHIGHAKALGVDFGIAREFGGRCHLRFDDTNPETEEERYAVAIREDVRWLGYDWGEHLYYASDYFERMYECAVILVKKGKAYVDSQSEEQIRETRGSVTEPGRAGPYRGRSVEENLDLLGRMRAGEFPNGSHVLRAKIDLAHPNMVMRDPVLYRIRHATHYRTGDDWCIYPLYDFAHCLEDAFEGVTHSICTLEFEPNREIYDWLLDEVGFEEPRTHQYEFARGKIEYTVVSKRLLLRLVREGHVSGWDDPRMPTIAGFRRRGVTPEAIRAFWEMVGVTKADTVLDLAKLEFHIRDHLNQIAPRVMCVLRPLKLVITNLPEGSVESLDAPYFPHDVGKPGSRAVPFARELWIDKEDFSTNPPKGWKRLTPGGEVRLRYGYVVRCDEVIKDASGEVVELRCSYDAKTRGGGGAKGIGTIHWVSAAHALPVTVRLYDRLFAVVSPEEVPGGGDFTDNLNPHSLEVIEGARIEPSVSADPEDTRYQFERTGYFWRDAVDSKPGALVFNRIVTLRDSWTPAAAEAGRSVEVGTKPDASRRAEPGPKGPAAKAEKAEKKEGAADAPGRPRHSSRDDARAADAELASRRTRYQTEMRLSAEQADILTGSRSLSHFFEAALSAHSDAAAVAAWVVNELPRVIEGDDIDVARFGGGAFGRLVALVATGRLSRSQAREVLAEMAASGGDPEAIARTRGLEQTGGDDLVVPAIDAVLAEYPDKVRDFRGGKTGLLGFFVGEVMKRTRGKADPARVKELVSDRLGAGASA